MSKELCKKLGISEEILLARGFIEYPEATALDVAEATPDRTFELVPEAAAAWKAMKAAAAKAGIKLWLKSAFRSISYQAGIIRDKIANGETIEQILAESAPPGYSEHHTGLAVDINSLKASFENTDAYEWLTRHAGDFGFELSYPRNNAQGYNFEPWHWRFSGTLLADAN